MQLSFIKQMLDFIKEYFWFFFLIYNKNTDFYFTVKGNEILFKKIYAYSQRKKSTYTVVYIYFQ